MIYLFVWIEYVEYKYYNRNQIKSNELKSQSPFSYFIRDSESLKDLCWDSSAYAMYGRCLKRDEFSEIFCNIGANCHECFAISSQI